MVRICRGMGQGIDVRELVFQQQSTRASHASGANRITVQELLDLYRFDETLAEPPPTSIAIVDDMLTAGTHYRAMHSVLAGRYPDVPIIGLFIARRVFLGPGNP
jgi:hypothetical protein